MPFLGSSTLFFYDLLSNILLVSGVTIQIVRAIEGKTLIKMKRIIISLNDNFLLPMRIVMKYGRKKKRCIRD